MSKYEWDNHKDTDFTEFERFFRDSNIQPIYDTRADYTTNAPSFYEYLARHNHLIKILARRIYDYDKELAKRFEEWDKRIENLPDELKRMFLEWVDDGTLARILAQLLLDDYATKEEVNNLLNALENTLNINLSNFKNEVNIELEEMNETIKDTFFYDEITLKEFDHEKGTYYVITIPTKDKKGNNIRLTKEFNNNEFSGTLGTALDNAVLNKSSLTINASRFSVSAGTYSGIQIKDRQVLRSENNADWTLAYNKETNELKAFPFSATAQEILDEGFTDTFAGFYPLIIDGVKTDWSVFPRTDNTELEHPRQVIAQMKDKTIKVFTFRGREHNMVGFNYDDLQEVLLNHGVNFAYNLDGGGSTQTVKSGIQVNPPLDENKTKYRDVSDFIHVIKPTEKPYEDIYRQISLISDDVKEVKNGYLNKYQDTMLGNLYLDNFMYMSEDKYFYWKMKDGTFKRVLGMINDNENNNRIYFGNATDPITILTGYNIAVNMAGRGHTLEVRANDYWSKITLNQNFKHFPSRELKEKYINAFESRLKGAIYVGKNATAGSVIGTLSVENRPNKYQIIVPVSTVGVREHNEVIIQTDGKIVLRYPVTYNEGDEDMKKFIHIECIINKSAEE